MKRSIVVFALFLVIIIGSWIFIPTEVFEQYKFLPSAFVLVIILSFGLWFVFRRLNSFKKEEPAEDELSRLILQRSASLSYYVSLYMWLIISYYSERLDLETDQLIGYGIVGMAILFVGFWIFYKIKGVKLN